MIEKETNLRGRSEIGVIAFYVGIVTAAVFALFSEGLVRIVAFSVLGLFGLCLLVGDVFLAVSDERGVKRNPHDNRNSDVGRKVEVVEDFVHGAGTSTGKVALAGETWKARSQDGSLHRTGVGLVVVGVEGLTLVVAPPDASASRSTG